MRIEEELLLLNYNISDFDIYPEDRIICTSLLTCWHYTCHSTTIATTFSIPDTIIIWRTFLYAISTQSWRHCWATACFWVWYTCLKQFVIRTTLDKFTSSRFNCNERSNFCGLIIQIVVEKAINLPVLELTHTAKGAGQGCAEQSRARASHLSPGPQAGFYNISNELLLIYHWH